MAALYPTSGGRGRRGRRRPPRWGSRRRPPPRWPSAGCDAAAGANPSPPRRRSAGARPTGRAHGGSPRWRRGSPPGCAGPSAGQLLGLGGGHGVADALGLLDRQLRGGRRALLEELGGEEAGKAADREEDDRHHEEAERGVVEEVGEAPGPGVQQEQEADDGEDAGGGADDRAAHERLDLGLDLGLRELDLLAEEQRKALGDLLDGLPDLRVLAVRLWVRSQGAGE